MQEKVVRVNDLKKIMETSMPDVLANRIEDECSDKYERCFSVRRISNWMEAMAKTVEISEAEKWQ